MKFREVESRATLLAIHNLRTRAVKSAEPTIEGVQGTLYCVVLGWGGLMSMSFPGVQYRGPSLIVCIVGVPNMPILALSSCLFPSNKMIKFCDSGFLLVT